MKDFKNKKLYDDEIGKFETFINERLETKSEYNKYDTGKEEEEIEDFGAVQTLGFGGMDDPFGDLSSGDNSFGGFGDAFSDTFSQGSMSNKKNFTTFENDSSFSLFLKSPIYLSDYVFKDLIYKENTGEGEAQKFNLKLDHAKDFFKYIGYSGLFLASTSLMSLMLGTNSLHTPILGLSVGFASILGGEYFNWKYFNQGIVSKYYPNENPSSNKPIEDIENPEMGEEGAFDFNEGVSNFSFDDFDTESAPTISLFDDEDEDEEFEDDSEDTDNSDVGVKILPESNVETNDDYDFKRGLIKEFLKNEKYTGRYLETRKETLDSFAGLLLNNDKNFSKWIVGKERSSIFNNISYTIFKALSSINKTFAKDDTSKITVLSVQYSPLIYKVEVKLPANYFDESTIKRNIKVFENFLKSNAADTEVLCMVSVSGDSFIFRFLRLDYNGLISIGDILRYKDDGVKGTSYQQMIDPKLGTPMLVGLRDNEYPHVIDLEANTAMAIVGGSGSGKSWLTYQVGTNIVTTNDYNEVNFIVLDMKNAPFWQSFARMPHVIGYHAPDGDLGISDEDYLELALKISSEVVQECSRRQTYLNKIEMEDAKEVREYCKKNRKYDDLKKLPLLIFCIDEITSTLGAFHGYDKEKYDAFRNNLNIISQKGRSAGVRLQTVGQRAIDTSLPKNVRANTTILFGMKMTATSDFSTLFDKSKEVENMTKPSGKGQGIVTSEDHLGYHSLKTLTPGGKDNSQIRSLLRVIAFDWVRRAKGRDDLFQPPFETNFKYAYNRPLFLEKTYGELREGKIFNSFDVYPEVAIDLTDKNPVINRNTTIMDKVIEQPKAKEEIVEEPIIGGISLDDFLTSNAEDFLEDDSSLDYDDSLPVSHTPEPQPYTFNDSDEDDLLEDEDEDEDEDMGESLIAQETIPLLDEDSELDNYLPDDFDFDVAFDENFSLDSEQQSVVEKEDEEKIAERERIRLEIEKERMAEERLRMQQEIEAERLELQRLKENQEREQERFRQEKERLEQERLQQERLQQERYHLEQERIEQERIEKERKLMEERKSLTENVQKPKETFTSNENPRVVNLAYHSQANTQVSNADKIDIREFIFTNGSKLSDFEYAVSTEMLKANYTKAEIARAIKIGDIYEAKDGYVSII